MQQPPTPSSARHDTPIELPLPPSTLVGLAVGILAVALIAFLTYQALAIREVAAARISSAQETITQLETLLSSLKDAETAQRGYLLTGAERYLEPYTDARAAKVAMRREAASVSDTATVIFQQPTQTRNNFR